MLKPRSTPSATVTKFCSLAQRAVQSRKFVNLARDSSLFAPQYFTSIRKEPPMEGVFVSNHPLVKHKLSLLRDIATDSTKFRQLVRELAILLTYEATADLTLAPVEVTTPLAKMEGQELQERIGLVPILRAGLGMVNGVWEMM